MLQIHENRSPAPCFHPFYLQDDEDETIIDGDLYDDEDETDATMILTPEAVAAMLQDDDES
ncbi:hypothetical protein ACQZV8_00060 [Magnetococcales bacterium HHB-1]